jgi:sigma-B regulation protein RsbQ
MWRLVAPAFEDRFRVVLYDLTGSGGSDLSSYDRDRYSTLRGHADDVLELCAELELDDVTFVGHSVSAMIGVLAAVEQPERFARLVLIGPSPRYTDIGDYRGGFSSDDIDQLLESLDSNYLGWAGAMAPVIMGNPDRPALGAELTSSFCRTDPDVARHFARVTFTSDNRDDLVEVTTPTLILQSREDVIAPPYVGDYVHDAIAGSRLTVLDARGHCPHLSAPEETLAAIAAFVGED